MIRHYRLVYWKLGGWGTAILCLACMIRMAVATPVIPLPTANHYRFAVIGDFGDGSPRAEQVAQLVASWEPDFVISLGDNNYPNGEAATIDDNIGQYYSQFIGNYQGDYGSGSPTNRFWPSLGNHDWLSLSCEEGECYGPYFDYFTLPGNERYYDVDYGLIHLFAVDGDFSEPDNNRGQGVQANWLQNGLATSTACYKVVFFHNSPYSSGYHGSQAYMQWPFGNWRADVVLSGHDHNYERLDVMGMPYFVNGLGGGSITSFANGDQLPPGVTSLARYNREAGAMLVEVTADQMLLQFYNIEKLLIDEYVLQKGCVIAPTVTPTPLPTNTTVPTMTPTATPTAVATPVLLTATQLPTTTAMVTAVPLDAVTPTALTLPTPPEDNNLTSRVWLGSVLLILLVGWVTLRFIKQSQ